MVTVNFPPPRHGKMNECPPRKGTIPKGTIIFQPLTFTGCSFSGRKQNGYAIDRFSTWLIMLIQQWEKNTVATTNPTTTQQKHCQYRFQTRLLDCLSHSVWASRTSPCETVGSKTRSAWAFCSWSFGTVGFSASLMVGTTPCRDAMGLSGLSP